MNFPKQGDPLEKLPWDSNWLFRKREERDETWNEFGILSSMEIPRNPLKMHNKYEIF